MIGLTGRGLIAGAMVIAFGSSDAVASSVQSQAGNDLSGFGKVLGMMIFGYVAIRLVRRRKEAGRAGRGNQNRSVKPVYIWLVVLAGLTLLYWQMG